MSTVEQSVDGAKQRADNATGELAAHDPPVAVSWSAQFAAAHHGPLRDPVTGLPGPTLLDDRVTHALGRCSRNKTGMAVLSANLERFDGFCQTFGEHLGNALLASVAQRLSGATRTSDTVSRVDQSRFVVVFEDLAPAADTDALLARITWLFDVPFVLSGMQVDVGAEVLLVEPEQYQPSQ